MIKGVRKVIVPVDDMAALGQVLPPDEQPGGPATGRAANRRTRSGRGRVVRVVWA